MTENLVGPAALTDRAVQRAEVRRTAEKRSLRTATWNMTAGSWTVGVWYWAIVVVVAAVIGYLGGQTNTFEGEPIEGVVNGSVKFFLFVLGIIFPIGSIAVHVAAGGTRRSLIRAAWLTAGVVGVTFGLAAALLGYAEWAVFRSLGWLPTLESSQLDVDARVLGTVFLSQVFFCAVYWLVGAAIGMGYYRLRFLRGTFALPLLLVPVALVELAFQSGYFGKPFAQAVGLDDVEVLIAVGGGLVALAAAAFAFRLVTRSVAIAPVTT